MRPAKPAAYRDAHTLSDLFLEARRRGTRRRARVRIRRSAALPRVSASRISRARSSSSSSRSSTSRERGARWSVTALIPLESRFPSASSRLAAPSHPTSTLTVDRVRSRLRGMGPALTAPSAGPTAPVAHGDSEPTSVSWRGPARPPRRQPRHPANGRRSRSSGGRIGADDGGPCLVAAGSGKPDPRC